MVSHSADNYVSTFGLIKQIVHGLQKDKIE